MEAGIMVIDTSIFIEFLRSRDKANTRLAQVSGQGGLYVSAMTAFELHMGATDVQKKQDTQLVLSGLTPVPMDAAIAEQAGDLFQYLKGKNQLIGVRDLIIAATALTLDEPILTLNRKHFERVPGLRLS